MDFLKMKLPIVAVIAALGVAAGSGGTVAVATARIESQEARIKTLEVDAQDHRDRLVRIETVVNGVSKSLERIERKLEHDL